MTKKDAATIRANAQTHLRDLQDNSMKNGKVKVAAAGSSTSNSSKLPSKDKENHPLKVNENQRASIQQQKKFTNANIDKLVEFIEGGPQNEAAAKKAQKKARQKQKKEEERRQREEEEEAQRRAEEARLRRERELAEQQRIREELALQKSLKKNQKPAETTNKSKNKKKNQSREAVKQNQSREAVRQDECKEPVLEHFEQTIPAMVTIKRIVENNNSPPTVTITLKGSTPDQDKLLYTLVNGHDAPLIASPPAVEREKSNKQSNTSSNNKQNKNNNKMNSKQTSKQEKQEKPTANNKNNEKQSKKKGNNSSAVNNSRTETVQTSEIKVQFAIDQSFRKDIVKAQEKGKKQPQPPPANNNKKEAKTKTKTSASTSSSPSPQNVAPVNRKASQEIKDLKEIIDIPSIKLPPGITITKVSGPLTNRRSSATQSNEYAPDVPVSKSGVIVVDTEKLIQQQTGKKKKKKKKSGNIQEEPAKDQPRVVIKSSDACCSPSTAGNASAPGMVTLKNPIFHSIHSKPQLASPAESIQLPAHMMNINEQATISQGENGMVTIRRPRPVGFIPPNESSITEYLQSQSYTETVVKPEPSPAPPASTQTAAVEPWQMSVDNRSALSDERKIIRPPSPRSAQWSSRNELDSGKLLMNAPGVLQGLPGIEITRVRTGSPLKESDLVEPPANVSIIRTGGYNRSGSKQNWTTSS